ncbi:MAG: hypothetical protein Q7U97_05585 [Rhodocyclaceae bacterium]|nr:hypothetical protein [Rhodocyclaceae bacterium]
MSATVTELRPSAAPAWPVHAYVASVLEAANSLMRDGFEIMAFLADAITPAPVIWVNDCSRLRNLARVGIASYERTGQDKDGPYRVGVFVRCGVTVQWLERVKP